MLIGFLSGVMVGAIAALLFAPQTGEELRGQLSSEASSQWDSAQRRLQQSMDSLQRQLTDLQSQVSTLAERKQG